MDEGLVKPPQMKPCWVAPPHLPQGGTILIFSLPGQGHVMTDRARVALKTFCMALFIVLYSYSQILFFFSGGGGGGGGVLVKTILNACLVIYKKLTP